METNQQMVSRKDREREQHRIEILDAAERVFVRDGQSTKIESIAKEAEFAVGSIYNFFDGKDDLFDNVLLRISQIRVEEITSLLPGIIDDPWNGMADVVRFWIDHHVKHGDFLHVALSQRFLNKRSAHGTDDQLEKILIDDGERYRLKMLEYFAALSRSPEARPLDPSLMFVAFEGFVRTSLFMAHRKGHGTIDTEKLVADVAKSIKELFSR